MLCNQGSYIPLHLSSTSSRTKTIHEEAPSCKARTSWCLMILDLSEYKTEEELRGSSLWQSTSDDQLAPHQCPPWW